jgi:hypothetical protein
MMRTLRAGLMLIALLTTAAAPSTADQPGSAVPDQTLRVRIVDGSAVLGRTSAGLQTMLGQPVRSRPVPPGDFRLPEGGIWREYRGQGARIDVDFEQDLSTTVMIEFADRPSAPRTYEEALEAVNLPYDPRPDFATRASQEWHVRGVYVRVVASPPGLERIDRIILSVHPLP